MTITDPEVTMPMSMPTSEPELVQALFKLPYRQRASAAQGLALTHGDRLLPLLEELLATKDAIHTIPVVKPAPASVQLNADGGNPNPEVQTVTLSIPQTNATARYFQRDLAIAMTTTLAQGGHKRAVALLLANLNHPHTGGKKQIIQCLVKCASDDDLLLASRESAPAVRDSLTAALSKVKRHDLVSDILGKPRRKAPETGPRVAFTTRFKQLLERSTDFERINVWRKQTVGLDVRNQPKPNLCEEGESVKDALLTLQEIYPPLHPWNSAHPEQRAPQLAPVIENHLLTFLQHDAERTMKIILKTSIRSKDSKTHILTIPSPLHGTNKSIRQFWTHYKDDGRVLQEYWQNIFQFNNGEFLRKMSVPYTTLFNYCRGPVVDKLVRLALELLTLPDFEAPLSPGAITVLEGILTVASHGTANLTHRLKGCSVLKTRQEPTAYFHGALRKLIALLCSMALAKFTLAFPGNTLLATRLYIVVLKPLFSYQNELPSESPFRSFPLLGQYTLNEIHPIFKPKFRKEDNVRKVAYAILAFLAPRDTSIYAIPDDALEQFSSVPDWDNAEAFKICVADCLRTSGKEAILLDSTWLSHWCQIAPTLTQTQRDEVVHWIMALPNFKTLMEKTQGSCILPMLSSICTNRDLRHEVVYPLVFPEKKEIDLGDNIAEWAAFLNIGIPAVRAQLIKETTKPSFEDRLKWIQAVLKATRHAGTVKEWVLTLKWLVPKIRNEIQPNLMALAPSLLPEDTWVPRQYLDNATVDEAKELSALYLAMDAQNSAAITPAPGITRFVNKIANEAFKRFVGQPDHPLYFVGTEIPWRRKLADVGEMEALKGYNLMATEPNYSDLERDEAYELKRRQVLAWQEELEEIEGGSVGLGMVPDGSEEIFVQGKLGAFHARWLATKAVLCPEVEASDLAAFEENQEEIFDNECQTAARELEWRWKRSPTLVKNLEKKLKKLAAAPTKTFGQDEVLNWEYDYGTYSLGDVADQVDRLAGTYNSQWLQKHRHELPWLVTYGDLKLRSNMSTSEAGQRIEECVLENGKPDTVQKEKLFIELLKISPSAIHLIEVEEYLKSNRPDLLTDEHLSMTKTVPGVFNQEETPVPWNLFVNSPARLSPHQCDLLKARHLVGMNDSSTPFTTRVQHAQHFVSIPTTTVQDVAEALSTPSLPTRISEALLMYIPTLGEPACTLQLLLAPAYIQSHMARTAIHAVDNALQYVQPSAVPDYLLPLFPPAKDRQQKVTVQKEGVRLACRSMGLVAEPRVHGLLKELWARADLNVDVRTVILQNLLKLLNGHEATEERFKDLVQWIWELLSETAKSEEQKKSGAAIVLLAVEPSRKNTSARPTVSNNGFRRPSTVNATLSNFASQTIAARLIDSYVDNVLIPMCARPTVEDDEDLETVRVLALQKLATLDGWITPKNAPIFATEWRLEAAQVPLDGEDPESLWALFVLGVVACVGVEVEGALAEKKTGHHSVAWAELVGVVQDAADQFLDKSHCRNVRQKALERIKSLKLGSNMMLVHFKKAMEARVFDGQEMDIVRPLMNNAMESVLWNVTLEREVAVFKPESGLTQGEINQEAIKILLRIVHFSNRYLSTLSEVDVWVRQMLWNKAQCNYGMRACIGRALLEPQDELADWIHLDNVALSILSNNTGIFSLKEIGGFVEKIANQDLPTFYSANRGPLANILAASIQSAEKDKVYRKHLADDALASYKSLLTPIVERARSTAWADGPDASILEKLLSSCTNVMCSIFPETVGAFVHQWTIKSTMAGQYGPVEVLHMLSVYVQGALISAQKYPSYKLPNVEYGLSPMVALWIEALLDGHVEAFDFAPFAAAAYELPDEVLFGQAFAFNGKSENGAPLITNCDRKDTVSRVEAYWTAMMRQHSGYFKAIEDVVHRPVKKPLSPLLLQAYRRLANNEINLYPKFVVLRPTLYLGYMRLVLTTPGTTVMTSAAAEQMAKAFTPVKEYGPEEHAYAWAPPLGLALDMTAYLLKEVREEARFEGEREARMIEQWAAQFLKLWLQKTVETPCGKLMAEAEDAGVLEARYLALVDELCEDGSGGQHLALQLPDFIPGGKDLVVV